MKQEEAIRETVSYHTIQSGMVISVFQRRLLAFDMNSENFDVPQGLEDYKLSI